MYQGTRLLHWNTKKGQGQVKEWRLKTDDYEENVRKNDYYIAQSIKFKFYFPYSDWNVSSENL